MGFTSGFTGGVAVTLGLAYLTVQGHERNRRAQGDHLRSQARVLSGLLEPTPIAPPQSRAGLAREERGTFVDTAKDRWNEELENVVRRFQRTEWNDVREGMEGAVGRLLGTGFDKSGNGTQQAGILAAPGVHETIDASKAAARREADQAATVIDRATAAAIRGADKADAHVREQLSYAGAKAGETLDAAAATAERGTANAKSGTHEALESIEYAGGDVDGARGPIHDAVTKGIQAGKEVVGKAQAAVGLATEKMGSKAQSSVLSHSSAVEKALHERYEKSNALEKSMEEALAERYTPVDSKDSSAL